MGQITNICSGILQCWISRFGCWDFSTDHIFLSKSFRIVSCCNLHILDPIKHQRPPSFLFLLHIHFHNIPHLNFCSKYVYFFFSFLLFCFEYFFNNRVSRQTCMQNSYILSFLFLALEFVWKIGIFVSFLYVYEFCSCEELAVFKNFAFGFSWNCELWDSESY